MGVFEVDDFAAGTLAVAEAIADSSAFSVVGGGESVMAIRRAGVFDRIDHVSTGGGASLECLSGETLPAIAALEV
jgi:phosphoglycerate kinase